MKKVSEEISRYQIKGMLMPINPASNAPIFLPINDTFILPIFSSREKFDEAAKWGGFEFAKHGLILNTDEFKTAVLFYKKKHPFHVVIDPYITPEGNTRFQLVPFDDEEKSHLGEKDERKS